MRVLLLGPYPPPHGGVQTNLVAIRRFLRDRGTPCAVINLTRHRHAMDDQVFHPRSGLGVLRLLLQLRSDIIHLHLGGDVTPRLLALSVVCCSVPGAKTVLTFHSGGYASSEDGRSAHPKSLRAGIFRRFDRVIAVNAEIRELFLDRFGLPPDQVRLIYPHALSAPPDGALPEAIARFLEEHSPVLVTVGLLEPEYDLPLQIEALGRLRERFQGAGLLIIGSGSLEPGLRNLIESKPYSRHVLLCGDVPHESTLRAIAQCHLFLRTTLYDGDSISVREALHLGTPVVATDNGMRPATVRLVPAANLEALCRACETQLCDKQRDRTPASGGNENIRAVYDLYCELADG